MKNTLKSMLNSLSTEQLALINAFMYFDGMVFKNDKSIGYNIDEMRTRQSKEWKIMLKKHPGTMSVKKAEQVVDAIMKDPQLRNLKVIDCTRKEPYYTGAVNACFVDEKNKQVLFAFRGTNREEWMDNAEAFLKESSPMQEDALQYVERIIEENGFVEEGYAIDVTGHSKGGNKAQYVTIKSPYVRECHSFDGQGFSKEFMEANKTEIAERAKKITSHAAHLDYVHCLGQQVAGKNEWYDTNRPAGLFSLSRIKLANVAFAHSPGACFHFDKRGDVRMNAATDQSKFSGQVHDISVKMMEESKEKQEIYFNSVMASIQMTHTFKPLYNGKLPDLETIRKEIAKKKVNLDETLEFMQQNGFDENKIIPLAQSRVADVTYKAVFTGKAKKELEAEAGTPGGGNGSGENREVSVSMSGRGDEKGAVNLSTTPKGQVSMEELRNSVATQRNNIDPKVLLGKNKVAIKGVQRE